MKRQSKIIYLALMVAIFIGDVSCKKGFTEINAPYKDAVVSTATPAGFFNNLARRATDDSYILHTGLLMPITNQQGVQNVIINWTNYVTPYWQSYYQDLADYKQLLKLIKATTSPEAFNNVKAMATILISSKTLSMLDRYGDIPYSEAANATEGIAFYKPKYDKQEDIYNSVLDDLKAAVTDIGGTGQVSISTYESFLANDFTAWKKFGNALRLRYAVRLGKTNLQTKAKAIITEILGNTSTYPLPDNQDLANLYKSNFGNYPLIVVPASTYSESRYWVAFREQSLSRMRMSSNVWNQMSSTNADNGSGIFDPRCKVWFMPNNAGKWVPQPQDGSIQDGGNPYPNAAAPIAVGADPQNKFAAFNFYFVRDFLSLPYVIITEADVHFLKAEIYNQGLGIAADQNIANTEYRAGIKASINFWYTYANVMATSIWPANAKPGAITQAQIDAFIDNNPSVKFVVTDPVADNYKKIIKQSWLANLFQPVEAWCTVRRTGVTPKDPAFNPTIFNRLPYPADEETNNNANWRSASGGNAQSVQIASKVYWMP